MNKKLLAIALSMAIAGSRAPAQNGQNTRLENEKKETVETVIKEKRPFQLTFVYPLGTDGVNSSNNEYSSSFNIIGGRTGIIKGFEIGSIFNINKYASNGTQIAGVMNHTGTSGNNEASKNVQIAGISNWTRNGVSTQIGGITNIAESAPVQIAGIVNMAEAAQVQIAGIVNQTQTNGKVQIAGIANMTKAAQVQIAGIANMSKTAPVQIAGIVNVTKKGGFQLGVVNIRDTADGIPIGVVNIVKKGGFMEWELGGCEMIYPTLSFRSGVQKLYSIISVGYHPSDKFYAFGFGVGSEITLKNRWGLNLEAVHFQLHDKDNLFKEEKYGGLVQFRPTVNYAFAKHFKIYAGPTLNLSIINDGNLRFAAPYSIWKNTGKNRELNTWVGFTAGFRF